LVVLGFGEHHKEITQQWAQEIAQSVYGLDTYEDARLAVAKVVKRAGSFKDTGYGIVDAFVSLWSDYEGHCVIVVDGKVNHYRDDCGFSPDGFAMLQIPYCVTYLRNDCIDQETYYIAV